MHGNQGMQRRELMQWFVRCLGGAWQTRLCLEMLGLHGAPGNPKNWCFAKNFGAWKAWMVNRQRWHWSTVWIYCVYIYIIICACVCVFRLWKHLGPQLNTFGSFFHWLIDSYQRPHLNNHYIHQWPKWIPFVVPWLYLTLKPPSNQVDGSSLFTPVQQPWARPDVKPKERGRRLAGP